MKEIKITIVTPCYNSEKYIEECITSIMNQKYKNFEHIIVDGGSTDNTLEIIKKYEGKYNMKWLSESDNGMYDAINKGFREAKGDVFCWLNSDDIYFPWTLEEVALVMSKKDVKWCTAREGYIDERSRFFYHSKTVGARALSQKWIRNGYADGCLLGYIMQESTFWTRELWIKAGGVDAGYRLAGDFYLWKKFAEYEPLYLVNSLWAAFRKSKNQLSADVNAYNKELPHKNFWHKFLAKTKILFLINVFFKPNNKKFLIQIEDLLNG